MTQVNFDQMQVGKRYRVEYPWLPGCESIGVLMAIRNLTRDSSFETNAPYRQFVLLTDAEAKRKAKGKGFKPTVPGAMDLPGDSLFYDSFPKGTHMYGKTVNVFEL